MSDYIQPLKYQVINTNESNPEASYETPVSESTQQYYNGLQENALYISPERVQSMEDVWNTYEFGATFEQEQKKQDTLGLIQSLAEQGLIHPSEAMKLLQEEQEPVEGSLERLQAEQAATRAAAEDSNILNYVIEHPEGLDSTQRKLANRGIWQSLRTLIDNGIKTGQPVISKSGKRDPGGKAGWIIKGFLPGVDMYRGFKASFVPGEVAPFSYDVMNAQEVNQRIDTMNPKEFLEYATNLLAYLVYEKELSLPHILDLWDKAERPSNENYVSFLSDIFDATGVALATKTGVKGVEASAKAGAKLVGGTKGAIKGAIEAVPLGGLATRGGTKAYKKLKSFASDKVGLKLASGNYEGAVKTIVSDLEKGIAGVETAEEAQAKLYEYVIDPWAKPAIPGVWPQAGRHSSIHNLTQQYETTSAVAKSISEGQITNKAYDTLLNEAIESRYKQIFNTDNLTEVTDIQPVFTTDNAFHGRVTIGKEAAVPFASKEEAAKALNRWSSQGIAMGELKPKIIESANGAFFIQTELDIKEPVSAVFKRAFKGSGTVKPKFLLGTRGSLPSHWEGIRALAQIDVDKLRKTLEPYQKALEGLNKSEKELLETLKEISQERWFTPEYLEQVGVPDKVVQAYNASRLIEDLNWAMHGFDMSKSLREEGIMNIAGDPSKRIYTGKIVDPKDADYDGRWFVKDDGSIPLQLKKDDFIKGKYKEFAIVDQIDTIDDVAPKKAYVLVPKDQLRQWPLDKFFGAYVPGGRHFYSPDAYFIKQPVISRLPNMRRMVTDIATLGGSMDKEVAVGWAKEVEDVRSLVANFFDAPHKGKSIKGKIALDNIIRNSPGKYVSWNSTEDFVKFAKEHNIGLDPKATIGVLKEGHEEDIYGNLLKEVNGEDYPDFAKFLQRNRYSSPSAIAKLKRGEGVRDVISDSHLPWISLNEELKRLVSDMEKFGSMNSFTKLYANDWYDTFKPVLQRGMDPVKALTKGAVNSAGDPQTVKQALYAKRLHDYIRGVPNALDKAAEEWLGNFLLNLGADHKWLKEIPLIGNAFKEGSRTYNMLSKLTPLNYLRTWTAHYYLGFLNPRQLFSQGLAVFNTAAISPSASMRALPYSFVVPSLMAKADRAAFDLAKGMIKKADDLADVSKLDVLVKNLDFLGVKAATIHGGAFADLDTNMSKLSKTSLWFFQKGETFNRVHSAITALMEKGYEWTDISKLSAADLSDLTLRMNDLYMNMGKTGVSFAQMSGLGKTLLQMKGFQLRFLEALTNKSLTAAERMRLFTFNLLATGIKGTIGAGLAYNVYDWMTEDAGIPDEVALVAQEGILNSLSRQLSDHPIDFADLLSPEAGNAIEDVFSIASSGPLQFMAGSSAAGKTWRSIATAANVFSAWTHAEADTPLLKNMFAMLAAQKSLPSGLNNLAVAAHIATAGKKMSASGNLIGRDLSNYHAAAALLGLPLISEKDYYEMLIRRSNLKEKEVNAFKDLEGAIGLLIQDPYNSFNLEFFKDYFAVVSDNYQLTPEQRNNVWQKCMSHGLDRDTEFARKLPAGLIKLYGIERADEILKAKGYRQ